MTSCYFSRCFNINSYRYVELLMPLHGSRWEKRILFFGGQIKSGSPLFSVCIILFFTNFTHMWAHQVLDFSFKLPTCTWICHKITNAVKCNLIIKLTTKSTFYFRSAVPVFMWYCMFSALQLCTDQCVQAWQLLVHFGQRMSSFLQILVYSLTSFYPHSPSPPCLLC